MEGSELDVALPLALSPRGRDTGGFDQWMWALEVLGLTQHCGPLRNAAPASRLAVYSNAQHIHGGLDAVFKDAGSQQVVHTAYLQACRRAHSDSAIAGPTGRDGEDPESNGNTP